jgi:hypothetical protein
LLARAKGQIAEGRLLKHVHSLASPENNGRGEVKWEVRNMQVNVFFNRVRAKQQPLQNAQLGFVPKARTIP